MTESGDPLSEDVPAPERRMGFKFQDGKSVEPGELPGTYRVKDSAGSPLDDVAPKAAGPPPAKPPTQSSGNSGRTPPPADGFKALPDDIVNDKPVLQSKESRFSTGVKGAVESTLTKIRSPQHTIYGDNRMELARDLNATDAAHKTKSAQVTRNTFGDESAGGLDLGALRKWLNDNPAARQIPRKWSQRQALTPQETALYESNKPELDRFYRGDQAAGFTGAKRLLLEEDARNITGSLGDTYWPRKFANVGENLQLDPYRRPSGDADLSYGHVTEHRDSNVTPDDNPVDTMLAHINDLTKSITYKPLLERTNALKKSFEDARTPREADAVDTFIQKNILQNKSWMDRNARNAMLEGYRKEKVSPGYAFDSVGRTMVPEGKIAVTRQVGTTMERSGTDDLGVAQHSQVPTYQVTVDGKPFEGAFTKSQLLASKYAQTGMSRAPFSKLVDSINRGNSFMTLWGNTRAALNSIVRDPARIASSAPSLASLGHGISQYTRYAAGKSTPQELAEWKALGIAGEPYRGVAGEPSFTNSALSGIERAGYAGMEIPTTASKIVAYEMNKYQLRLTEPGMSEMQIQAEARYRASVVSDMMGAGARSPLSYDPLWKVVSYLSNKPMREVEQILSQARGGPAGMARLAANIGLTTAGFAALYSAVGDTDPEHWFKRAVSILPFSSLLQGEGPSSTTILPKKLAAGAKYSMQQLGIVSSTQKQRDASLRSASPSWLQYRSAKDLVIPPMDQKRGR